MYDAWPCYAALEVELRLSQEAMAQLTETGDKAEEKAKKAIEELKREPGLVPYCLPFLFIGVKKLKIVIIATLCAEFRHQSQAQFQVLMEQVKKREDQIEAIVARIGPMLDNIDLPEPEGARLLRDGPYQSIVDRYQMRGQTSESSHVASLMGLSFLPLHNCIHITRRLTCSGLQPGMRKV
jgi:hypothetical protein